MGTDFLARGSRMKSLVLVLVFLAWFAALAIADFDAGMAAYERGDYATALRERKPLAEQGDAVAQAGLGFMYEKGKGVPQDYAEALRWYRLAAEQGHAIAQVNLGTIYYQGWGVPQDYKEAVRWFRLAADQGLALAQAKMGIRYEEGEGVPQNYVLAHMWYTLAAAQGDKGVSRLRDILTPMMTPAQIAEAQKLAREWKPKK